MHPDFTHNPHNRQILLRLFGELGEDLLTQILEIGKEVSLNTGDFLFHQGDVDNTLYIVLSGRFRALAKQEDGTMHALGDIGEGEPIGEFALFMSEPRSAAVVAIRKSIVLELKENAYLGIVARYPAFSTKLTRFVVNRLRRNALQQHLETSAKNIAVINLQSERDISEYTDAIKAQFESLNVGIQILDHNSHANLELQTLYDTLEQHEGLNFLVCSDEDLNWSKQCIIYADLVVLATDFFAESNVKEIEVHLDLYSNSILNKKIYLLLLHPENARFPENTKRWFEGRKIDLHVHYRKNYGPDIRRFARILANKAIGLVLGGGGAKGFGHMGVIKALYDSGMEIDFLGGTSAGALYGLTASFCDFDREKIDYYSKDSANSKLTKNDFTFPLISFMSGKKMSNYIKKMFGEAYLEDFWVGSYCVSTNYSNASTRVHERGLAWKQVEASIAIPGIYPPVVIENQLHVDGGVVDNLPIETMYNYPVKHIIAISLTQLKSQPVDFEETPTATKIIWNQITGKRKFRLPGITSILVNSLTLNSRKKQEMTKSGVALYLELELKGIGMMDDSRWKEIVQKGYDQMKAALENMPEEQKFW
ncbi:patatin-like phospholipase domain-containing protein [Aquiflexum sp. TKW24L]|uniref:patatin-like phospholipase family protein n=1 Tax=Aquiflexum sp. TKW24L TaxID=2942212 RepID=UPI0020BE2768|nr:cyclic nucleotide-binding and patatin-like phospholipase domain-containing protein [Aquiflexum sp. TKW24L]MCL6257631.1 patatin-like phospholipase domain-containing protein [Aquiflexum sp. TKW24L]